MKKNIIFILCSILILIVTSCKQNSSTFSIIITQDNKSEADKYIPLINYLNKKNFKTELIPAKNYQEAADMFRDGKGQGMFSGSDVAGLFIANDLAVPLVRPLFNDDHSTYWTLILGYKGSKPYTGDVTYFNNKKIAACTLASSGDFYYKSLINYKNVVTYLVEAPTHYDAIKLLSENKADFAIVKNWVWESQKNNFKNIVIVGRDNGENPDKCLIISKNVSQKTVEQLSGILLTMQKDKSPEAKEALDKLNMKEFIITTKNDFKHTQSLLSKAGVNTVVDLELR